MKFPFINYKRINVTTSCKKVIITLFIIRCLFKFQLNNLLKLSKFKVGLLGKYKRLNKYPLQFTISKKLKIILFLNASRNPMKFHLLMASKESSTKGEKIY